MHLGALCESAEIVENKELFGDTMDSLKTELCLYIHQSVG